MSKWDDALLESGRWLRRGKSYLIGNFGRIIAALTATVACLVTFTDIGFARVRSAEFTAQFLLMLTAAYIIYFSMESAGEQFGEEAEAYRTAAGAYAETRARVGGDRIAALGDFCLGYAAEELAFRRRAFLFSHGLTETARGNARAKERALYRKAGRMRPMRISPAILLASDHSRKTSELRDPARGKLARLLLKLIPTTVCMTITVSVMLTAKAGMTAADVIGGIMRLSTLPVIAFRGYAEGYRYTAETLPQWIQTKEKLLCAFLNREDPSAADRREEIFSS